MSRPVVFFLIISTLSIFGILDVLLNYYTHLDIIWGSIDAGLFALFFCAISLIFPFLVLGMTPNINKTSQIVVHILLLIICSIGVAYIQQIIFVLLLDNYSPYLAFVHKTVEVRMILMYLLCSWSVVWLVREREIEELKTILQRNRDIQEIHKESELNALKYKLQPHFLFNSLNSINALISTNTEQAKEMIFKLSDFLRGTLLSENKEWISVDQESEHLSNYLEIEKIRFNNRLQVQLNIDQNALDKLIPSLLLQPIVENAIKYGLYNTLEAVLITIDIRYFNGYTTIEVRNPFDKDVDIKTRGTGFGLSSVQKRLQLLFSRTDLFQTQVLDDNVFVAKLRIPIQHNQINEAQHV